MNFRISITQFLKSTLRISLIALLAGMVHGQDKQQPPKTQEDDVVRVSTTLVQTDVTVVDKQGNFVEGLKPEQFQIKVNGTPVNISFLEMITTGSSEEKAQIAAARAGRPANILGGNPTTAITPVEGRSLFLFVDDLHLGAESLIRTRKMLNTTVDEMTANDRALIITSSGQLGAQQLSNDKATLKATIARIALRAQVRQSVEFPEMTEAAAIAVSHGDRSVLDYYVMQIRRTDPTISAEGAEEKVRGRADDIIEQTAPFASNTLQALESFAHDLSSVPGRKILFFISDGFMIENERSMSYTRLSGATQEAARAGVVVYTLNARGLVTGSPDASSGVGFQPALTRTTYDADKAAQEVLYSLAYDTGGQAFVNNNDINSGIRRALQETSKYYLLAWRPPQEVTDKGKVKRVQVIVTGRPELQVRTRRGLADAVAFALVANNAAPTSTSSLSISGAPALTGASPELMNALTSDVPLKSDIPISAAVTYRNATGNKFAVKTSLQMSTSGLTFSTVAGKEATTIDVAGVVLDASGKQIESFNKQIMIATGSNAIDPVRKTAFYDYDSMLSPGKYRVKVGVRDTKSGRMGSALQSLEIPEIGTGILALSSLMLNEVTVADDEEDSGEKVGVRKGVARRFAHDAVIRFLVYVYNAAPAAADDNEPALNVEAKILRSGRPILSPALREIPIEDNTDKKAFPYVAEIPLAGLQPGDYTLQIIVTDATSKTSATQEVTITVE